MEEETAIEIVELNVPIMVPGQEFIQTDNLLSAAITLVYWLV